MVVGDVGCDCNSLLLNLWVPVLQTEVIDGTNHTRQVGLDSLSGAQSDVIITSD